MSHDSSSRSAAGGTVGSMKLGDRLRAAIDAKGKAHAWVAQEVGITPASLSAILTGKTEDPSFFTVFAIARLVDTPLSAIADDSSQFWSEDDLSRLSEFGQWVTERSAREHSGRVLAIPPRKKSHKTHASVQPVAAGAVALYPDAAEMARKRIPAKFTRRGADAVFSVRGESMIGEEIFPGDLLYVHRTPAADEAVGRIVVCQVDDLTLVKRLRTRGRRIVLESANPEHGPIVVDEGSSRFRLIGVVVGTSRD